MLSLSMLGRRRAPVLATNGLRFLPPQEIIALLRDAPPDPAKPLTDAVESKGVDVRRDCTVVVVSARPAP